jgi:hypothetical protein
LENFRADNRHAAVLVAVRRWETWMKEEGGRWGKGERGEGFGENLRFFCAT